MSARTQRVLFYSNNGTGLGHLTRQLNIARVLRDLAQAQGLCCDIRFLTTSDAAQIANDFPVYKIPSKTTIAATEASMRAFKAHAQLFVANLVGQFSPDLLIMDTMPQGSHGEFTFIRESARRTLFVDRRKKPEIAGSSLYQSHLSLYDRILVPDIEAHKDHYPLANHLRAKRRFTGPIHGFRPEFALSREDVRERFGVRPHQRLIYVSTGGGGDQLSQHWMTTLIQTLASEDTFILAGYGPLYQGRLHYAANVVPLQTAEIRQYFAALDMAFSAAGYNSWQELLASGAPTTFFALSKGLDQQHIRIQEGQRAGWHRVLTDPDPHLIRREMEALNDEDVRAGITNALTTRKTPDGARNAALEALLLLPDVDPMLCRETAAFYNARPMCTSAPFAQIWPWTRYWLNKLLTPVERVDFNAHSLGGATLDQDCLRWLTLGFRTHALQQTLIIEPGSLRALVGGWLSRHGSDSPNLACSQALGLIKHIESLLELKEPSEVITIIQLMTRKLKEPLTGLRLLSEAAQSAADLDPLVRALEAVTTRLDEQEWEDKIQSGVSLC